MQSKVIKLFTMTIIQYTTIIFLNIILISKSNSISSSDDPPKGGGGGGGVFLLEEQEEEEEIPFIEYSCPKTPESNPIIILPSNNNIHIIASIAISSPGFLCTLTKVTTPKSSSSGGSGDDPYLIPIGRSYDGNLWESVAGPFQTLHYDCTQSNTHCHVRIPPLIQNNNNEGENENDDEMVEFRLTTYTRQQNQKNQVTKRDEISRFLIQSTFGPTSKELDQWEQKINHHQSPSSISIPLLDHIANWIHQQMFDIPITSHREFFRSRANPHKIGSAIIGIPDHPCHRSYSRWRKFAFVDEDYSRKVTLSPLLDPTNADGPFVLLVDGIPRTIVDDSFQFNNKDPVSIEINTEYEICRRPVGIIGGSLSLKITNGGRDTPCRYVQDGNPKINFPPRYGFTPKNPPPPIDTYYLGSSVGISVPIVSLLGMPLSILNIETSQGQELTMTDKLGSRACDSAVLDNTIFGVLPDGQYLIHDTRLHFLSNTLESPFPDGGGAIVSSSDNKKFKCANAPRTFLNAHTCRLSLEPTACGAQSISEETTILLNHQSLRKMFEVTGLYIYAIDGLRINGSTDGYIKSPCQPDTISRWIPIADTCASSASSITTSLKTPTLLALTNLIASSTDRNPHLRDAYTATSGISCHADDMDVRGMEIEAAGKCWRQVHPDHLSVFDMTYWTRIDTHDGNKPKNRFGTPARNPIKAFAESGLSNLYFPLSHPVDRWNAKRALFPFVGRLGDEVSFRDLPENLRTDALASAIGAEGLNDSGSGVVVCGSPGEVGNDPSLGDGFQVSVDPKNEVARRSDLVQQKKTAQTTIALTARDQLRQRVVWALSQILVISPFGITVQRNTETFMSYMDIFTRNAFGNYRDILKEVIYHPLMAEMLTYHESKSTGYIWDSTKKIAFADENFAREVMQLFTMGLIKLNLDGTPRLDENGNTIQVYDNDDIMSFSKVYTGFQRQRRRGNTEHYINTSNQVDPMKLVAQWRDMTPKMGLDGVYIGDRYPLCVDAPPRQFLRKEARYRLLGSSSVPEMHYDPSSWAKSQSTAKRLKLDPQSNLFKMLCDPSSPATTSSLCNFPIEVVLETNLDCLNDECNMDTVRVVQVTDTIFYEYIRPPCVEQAFFNGGIRVSQYKQQSFMCADPRRDTASEACCDLSQGRSIRKCFYVGERMTFDSATKRCQNDGGLCDFDKVHLNVMQCSSYGYFWTDVACSVRVKMAAPGGLVAIVHDVGDDVSSTQIPSYVHESNQNYFRVAWENGVKPDLGDDCMGGLFDVIEGGCSSTVEVLEEVVFNTMPTRQEILSNLHIGSFPPDNYDDNVYTKVNEDAIEGIAVYSRSLDPLKFDRDVIFEVNDEIGNKIYLKNVASKVRLIPSASDGGQFIFRNPPRFMNTIDPEARDAHYEIGAAIDHYLQNENVAPFLSFRFIQRFGISNPSPRYVKEVATAFRTGLYEFSGKNSVVPFGTGQSGDLAATFAAVLLDREARSVVLDADPTYGSLREPLLKTIHFLRSMELVLHNGHDLVKLIGLNEKIGQEFHEHPSVFNFYLPDFSFPGPIQSASLFSPEAQIMHMPTTVGILNGLFSISKFGITSCHHGFGPYISSGPSCSKLSEGDYSRSIGYLGYTPPPLQDMSSVVDDLATLLTGGRLSQKTREMIVQASAQSADDPAALRMSQQLIATTAEFHSTNIVELSGKPRRSSSPPGKECLPYKALVYLLLDGGCDSYNMLVPRSNCTEKDLFAEYLDARENIALDKDELLPINAKGSDQPCDEFGLHPRLSTLQRLYNSEEALFIANVGVLNAPVTIDDYIDKTQTRLFAHDSMKRELQQINPFDRVSGTGVCGRMVDVLTKRGFKTGAISIDHSATALAGDDVLQTVLSRNGIDHFDPKPSSSDMVSMIMELNEETTLESGIFGKTWSSMLSESLHQNKDLSDAMKNAHIETDFPGSFLGQKLETVARMISARSCQSVHRDVFFVKMGGFDTHSDMMYRLDMLFRDLDPALAAFETEMKRQKMWDNVALMEVSEFGRTLSANSGQGSDHGWGGHHFLMGGKVKGGKILGKYPDDLSPRGPLNAGRGRMLPTMSNDEYWNALVRWFGITDEADIDEVLPNRAKFAGALLSEDALFEPEPVQMTLSTAKPSPSPSRSTEANVVETKLPTDASTVSPTRSPTKDPTKSPTQDPTKSPTQDPTKSPTLLPTTPSPKVSPGNLPTDTPSKAPVSFSGRFRSP